MGPVLLDRTHFFAEADNMFYGGKENGIKQKDS